MESAMRILKVKYFDKIRKCYIPEEMLQYDEIRSKICDLFSKEIHIKDNVILEYLDEEKDWIILEDTNSLSMAMQENSLYIRVRDASSKIRHNDEVFFNKELDNSIQKVELIGNGLNSLCLSSPGMKVDQQYAVKCGSAVKNFDHVDVENEVNAFQSNATNYQSGHNEALKDANYSHRNAIPNHKDYMHEDDLLSLGSHVQNHNENPEQRSIIKENVKRNQYNLSRNENNVSNQTIGSHPEMNTYHQKNREDVETQLDQPQIVSQQQQPSQGYYQASPSGMIVNQKGQPIPMPSSRPSFYSTGQPPQMMGQPPQLIGQPSQINNQPPQLIGQPSQINNQPPQTMRPRMTMTNQTLTSQMNHPQDLRTSSRNMRPCYPNIGPPQQPYATPQQSMGMGQQQNVPSRPPILGPGQLQQSNMTMPPPSYGSASSTNYPPQPQGPTSNQNNRFPPPGQY